MPSPYPRSRRAVRRLATPPASSMPTYVRTGALSDMAGLLHLESAVFASDQMSRRSLRYLLTSRSAIVFIAENDRQIAGAAILLFRAGAVVARLYSLAVAPKYLQRGVGKALLRAVERQACAHGCRILRLEAHETNTPAIACYRGEGYREVARQKAYYGDGGDALRFEKLLTARGIFGLRVAS